MSNISRRDKFLLIFTFLTGMFSGFFFYVTSYAPYYSDAGELPDAEDLELNVIGVRTSGAAAPGSEPAYFELEDDRSYEYSLGGNGTAEEEEGRIPDDLMDALQEAVYFSDLESLASPARREVCVSEQGGVDYEYDLVINDDSQYIVNTCTTLFTRDAQLYDVLEDMWTYMETPERYGFSVSNDPDEYRGLTGWLRRRMNEAFDNEEPRTGGEHCFYCPGIIFERGVE